MKSKMPTNNSLHKDRDSNNARNLLGTLNVGYINLNLKIGLIMFKKITHLIFVLLFLGSIGCSNQKDENNSAFFQSDINNPEIEHRVDGLITPLVDDGLLSGSILIAKSGKIVFAKGYGFADRETKVPNTPETIFRIGSITKPITAIAVMQLHQKGKLNINDPLNKYLHGFPNGDKITIYNLLTHTSGLPSYDWTRSDNKPQELEVIIDWIKELTLQSESGQSFMYSNSGYALLAYIIEKVSGMKYEDYVAENIFIPCNMKNSGLFYSMNRPAGNMAFGYSRIDYNGFKIAKRVSPLSRGAGDLYSTILDLYKLSINIPSNTLLTSESWNEMFTPFTNSYGLGWPGGLLGYMGNLRIFMNRDIIVINLFNNDFLLTHLVEEQLAAIALGKLWQPLFKRENDQSTLDSFKAFTGEYAIDQSSSFRISVENGHIYFQESGQPKCIAYLFAENYIYIKEINSRIRFVQSEEGTIKYTAFFGLFLVTGERIQSD